MALFISQASALTRTTTTNTEPTFATQLSHNLSAISGRTYAIFWFAIPDVSTVGAPSVDRAIVRLQNTTASTTLAQSRDQQTQSTERPPCGGVALFTAGSTGTVTFAVQFARQTSATITIGCQQARIVIFELESGVDVWASSTSTDARSTTTYSSKVSMTVNLGTHDYLIAASWDANVELNAKINDGADIFTFETQDYWDGPDTYHNAFWFTKQTISSSKTFDLLAAANTGTSNIRNAYLLAMDLGRFAGNLFGSSLTQGDSTSATYASRATVTGTVNGGNHLVLGAALQFASASTSSSVDETSNHKLRAAGTDLGIPIKLRGDGAPYKYSAFMMSVESLTAGSRTIDWQWARNAGTATHSILSNVVAAIELAAASTGATITDVGTDEIIDDLQQNVVITGTAFGATQGTGKVEIGDNSTYASATKVQLPVDSWADTSITVDFQNITGGTAISLVLRTRPLYLFVTPNGGAASAAFPITLNDSDPYLKSLDEGLSMMSGLTPGTKPTGIVAHWHFDDPSGTTLEDRWRTHNGSLVNTPALAQTALPPTSTRSSMFFDSSQGEYAQVTHNAAFALATGAISGWFKPNSLANNSVVLSKNGSTPAAGDIRLKYDANGQITFSVWNATPTELTIQSPTGYVAVGQDVHFQIIWDNTGFELWLDGNEVGTKITSYTSGLTANTTRAWRFGAAGA